VNDWNLSTRHGYGAIAPVLVLYMVV